VYGGLDWHARRLEVCLLNQAGDLVGPRQITTTPAALRQIRGPSREARVVAGAWLFTWDGRAALCAQEGLPWVLGPALAMPARQGGQAQPDPLAAPTSAGLLPSGRRPRPRP
jgi:hypothetical protein